MLRTPGPNWQISGPALAAGPASAPVQGQRAQRLQHAHDKGPRLGHVVVVLLPRLVVVLAVGVGISIDGGFAGISVHGGLRRGRN